MAIPNTATATKTSTTSAAVTTVNAKLLAGASQSTAMPASPTHHQGTAGSSQSKNPPPGFEGPSTSVPGASKPGADSFAPKTAANQQASLNNVLGLMSKTDAIKSLAGIGTGSTAVQSEKDKLTDLQGAITNNKSNFDQSFGSQPDNFGTNPITGVNPMSTFQGQNLSGPLAAAAAASQTTPKPGSGAAGSGLVSDQTYPGATSAANAKTNSDGEVSEKRPTGGASKEWKDKLFLEKLADVITGMRNMDGTLTEKGKALQEAQKADAGMPNPENTGSNVNILTQTLLDQLNASKAGKPANQGGSGDATPVDNGGISQVVNNGSVAVNQGSINQRNMVGQPGGAALGENVSGGNKGINSFGRSNGAGAVDPGNEAGIPGGDPRFQQDPANALGGNKPAPTLQSPVGNQENQSSSVSATLTAGARNLTLTGTALINGTGNALDNVINGNSAANELRGEAGNDSLDGKAGNDLLDGGAGRDQLTGGSGADRFRFATAGAFGTAQADRITDFSRSEGDRIELSRSAFGLAAGASLSFQTVSNDADLSRALGSSTLLIQDLRDGSILFNQNGSAAGMGQGGVFAVVSQGLTLQAGDFALGA
jgi:Ca2+-binding RTX toxin-like protein